MSILPQHKHFLRPSYHASTYHHTRLPIRMQCAATLPASPKPETKQLTTVPPQLNQQLSTTTRGGPLPNDPSLQSTWTHRAWLASGCTTVIISLAKAIGIATATHMWLEPTLAGYIGYILADLGSGVFHWGIDNYGDASTPVFGAQIEAFQGHHKWPWTITRRQFANNLHALARAVTFTVLPINLECNDPTLLGFVGMFSGCIMFSQQFHSWAHSTKSKLPPIVVALQDLGVLVSRSQHAAHHRPPYNNNYCIVSGVWNKFLDENKVFEVLEMAVFFRLGIRPRSWSEPSLEWTEEITPSSQNVVQ
ncbi:Fatty acid desaturase 4, chloroplastic [Ancistrocladus abbreviatus]